MVFKKITEGKKRKKKENTSSLKHIFLYSLFLKIKNNYLKTPTKPARTLINVHLGLKNAFEVHLIQFQF